MEPGCSHKQPKLNFVNAKRIFIDVAEKHGIKVEFKMETSLISSQQGFYKPGYKMMVSKS